MKGMLAKVISTSQNAFVEGRQIMDAVLVANEAIDSIVKSNKGAILYKLDIEKAYDHVDWVFLLAMVRWIKRCLSTVRYSVMVNGSPTGFFQSSRGLRQGLRANMEKSELIPVDRVENVDELANEFGYKVGKLPSTYLGMSLGAPFKCVAAWDGIEERFRKKLAMWKRQYISKGGRITLVRSTLSNLPIYFIIRLEKIQRDFLWGGGPLEQKPHLVRWPIVCLDKRSGGLGVKSLGAFNKALLGKWAISKMGHLVTPSFGFVVGDGEKVRFWKDKWCETIPLCEAFPSLYALASNKEAWGKKVKVDEEDRVKWMESKNGVFSPKLSFFAWEASWGRVLTLDHLQKRGCPFKG
ncbi:hypothetical protein AAG906_006236 [Vitis piasezkii]